MAEIDFNGIKKHCTDLEEQYGERNALMDQYANSYLMEWEDKPSDPTLKITISPSARNRALGAKRLLIAAEPHFSVPFEQNDIDAQKRSDLIEKFAQAIWMQAGRIRQMPVEYDVAESAVVFGEIHAQVMRTEDVIQASKGASPSVTRRLEMAAAATPIMIEVYDPRTGYPEFDNLGLASYARKVTVLSGAILDRYGDKALEAGLKPDARTEEKELWEYWDWENHAVWVEGASTPLVLEPHNLGILPVVAFITDGSRIWQKPEQQRQAFLYTLTKSKLWERENLMLTYNYSNIATMGLSPTFRHQKADESDEVTIDTSISGGVASARGPIGVLEKNIIDPAVREGMQIAAAAVEESTMYTQALGAPLGGGNAAYSTVALLNSAGRLPLVTIQRMSEQAFGRMMEIALHLIKTGSTKKAKGTSKILQLKASDIPDGLIVDCTVDVNLPQDERQNAMVADQLVKSGMVSKRWARENILGVGQSKDMEQEIFNEAMDALMMQQTQQEEMQRAQQQAQPQPMPQQPQGTPAEQLPPEMAMMMQGGGAGVGMPGMPMAGPQEIGAPEMPPEMGMM